MIAPNRMGSRSTQEARVRTGLLVRPDQKEATTQLVTQASQISDSKLVGQVTSQPLNTASMISRGPLSMLQNLACGHTLQESSLSLGLNRPGLIGERRCPLRDADTFDVSSTASGASSRCRS